MKNLIYVVTLIFLVSCSEQENDTNVIENNSRITAKELDFIGKEHNEILERAFNFLNDNQDLISNKNNFDKKELLLDFLVSDMRDIKKYPEEYIEAGISHTKKVFNENDRSFLKNANNTIFDEVINQLSQKEIDYLDSLNSILQQENVENNTILEDILNLEISAENDLELSNNQLFVILAAASTAKNSFQYWDANYHLWESIDSNQSKTNIVCTKSSKSLAKNDGHNGCACANVSAVAKADVTGAVGMAVGAAAANIIVGPGTVAYGGAIISGAVGNSATEAASQILDWLGW